MPRKADKVYTLSYHLNKFDHNWAERYYKNLFDYASTRLKGVEFYFTKYHTNFRIGGKWFLALYAQKTMLTVDVPPDFRDYPDSPSVRKGSRFKHEKKINFHIGRHSSIAEVKAVIEAAYHKAVKQTKQR